MRAVRRLPAEGWRWWAATVAGVALGAAGCGVGPRTEGPNVVLAVLSTTRADHLSLYGYDKPTTPNLERLAREGVVYENCVSPAVWTLPSHASLFTGLYVRDHHTDGSLEALDAGFTTLAEVLAAAGYLTVGVSSNAWLYKNFGLRQGFEEFHPVGPREPQWTDDGAEATNSWIFQWLDGRKDPAQRFFLYLSYIEPAMPYAPPPPYDQRFLPPGARAEEVELLRGWHHPREMTYMLQLRGGEVTAEQFEILSGLYDGELAYVDSRLKELLDGLADRGLLEDTLVIVTADQGEHLGEHGMMHHKMSVYEPLLRVPLILRYPRSLPSGRRVAARVQTLDLFPTILSLCGVKHAGPTSAIPLPVNGGPEAGRAYTFAEFADPSKFLAGMRNHFPDADTKPFERSLVAVRGLRYKAIWGSDGMFELYDLAADPGEMNDLSRREPAIGTEMQALRDRFRAGELPE